MRQKKAVTREFKDRYQRLSKKGVLSEIDQIIREPYDQKEKDNLIKLYTYLSRNR